MYPRTPEGWTTTERRLVGPFPTSVTYRRPDGTPARWRSRAHRKHASALSRAQREVEGVWWAPRRASWWIGVLFAIGSACFVLGSLPGYLDLVGAGANGVTFFVGSIFFTSAAFVQYLEAANADRGLDEHDAVERLRILTFEPRRIDWWATSVQLLGTILFNLDTFDAMRTGLSAGGEDVLVWSPDALGSICFLVASYLAFAEACEAWRRWDPGSRDWRIGAINLGGSVAFGVSAVASYVVPSTGDVVDFTAVNSATAIGAACFLVGAVWLLPEGAEPAPPELIGARAA